MDCGKSKSNLPVWARPRALLVPAKVTLVKDNETLYSIGRRNLDSERLANTNLRRLPARNISSLSVPLHSAAR